MKTLIVSSLLLLLTGCGGLFGYNGMSPEQINAAVKDKSISVICSKVVGMGGTIDTVIVTYDQRVITNGGVSVGGEKCPVAVTDTKPAPPAVAPVAPAPKPVQ